MALIRFAAIGLILLLMVSIVSAQEPSPAAQPVTPATGANTVTASGTLLSKIPATLPPYPDSADGMKLQMANVLRTWGSGDKEKFTTQLDIFALADSKTWLTQTFGPERGAPLAPDYQAAVEKFKSHISWVSGTYGNDPALSLKVEPSELPKPADETGDESKLPEPIVPTRVENFRFTFLLGERIANTAVFSFVYADGAFRFVGGTYPFWNQGLEANRRPTVAPSRIRVGANVATAQLIHMVQPEYPRDSKKMHIQGIVQLHAIIGKDGHIKNLQVLDGDPGLAIAAQAAVQQWIYKPTLLNGQPVEVDTTIAINFALGPR